MKAIIKKIELKKILNRHYLNIELLDEDGFIRHINNPLLSDDINFRKLVFGVLTACNNYDLMTLATSNPEKRRMIGYYQNWLKTLENEKGEWLKLDQDSGLYTCYKPKKEAYDFLMELREYGIVNVDIDEGIIEAIISRSGTFQLMFTTKMGTTFFTTGQIYAGFGYPITIGSDISKKNIAISARMFTSFIVSLLQLYGINDLLEFGGVIEEYPEVEIELSRDNKIISMINPETKMGLSVGKSYEIINLVEEKEKVKRLK